MPRTHKFNLPSNTNKIYSNAFQMPKDIRIGAMTIVSNVETIMVTNDNPIEIKEDDNKSQPITEVQEEIKLEIKEIEEENVTIDDKQCVAEIHDIYEDKQSIIKNQLNPLFLKKVELKDMVSMVLSQSKMRKVEAKYGWNC